jgi:hypothetical protein
MRMRILLLGATLSIFTTASFASIITNGTFSIAGTIYVTGSGGINIPGVGVCPINVQCFFWQDTGTPAQNGKVDISPLGLPSGVPPNNIPLAISGNDAANMSSLFNPPDILPIFPAVPLMSFNNIPGLTTVLMVNNIPFGVNGTAGCPPTPAAPGQTCTIPGSPFNLQNLTSTSSTATFNMNGFTQDGTASWTGIFASQFNNMSYQAAIAQLNANGFISNTFSGQITLSVVPEPGSLSFLLLGSGMIVSATLLRRLSRR